ncbi:FAD/NAD(P)-binding protein [Muriicola marianensis]|uniref:FAD-dependent urate hydroxylase HpyO/Asp monooxygenase CreE-like FAD/NAD(P)-binding domain-containing protein n=1 Tax=Muriicola marianensis TaxID=1324801 RepID=A0ABQ1QQH6_9FLAO|nr:FAD/NAD(P)-binding protein [Muriicola marianensis]GGD41076.1 hypothetical protein GCM10011361_05200 [Muriicola marianensis]
MKHTPYDILYVGAGIATSFSLLKLLENLKEHPPQFPISIGVIDKYSEFFKGIPYGKRSGDSVLLINALQAFLPQPQREAYVAWLNAHKEELVSHFLQAGGSRAQKWLTDNQACLEKGQWDELFVPRSFFGQYIEEKVLNAVAEAEKSGRVSIDYHVGEVSDIEKTSGGFDLILDNGSMLHSRKVVLSIGSLPNTRLPGVEVSDKKGEFMTVHSIYDYELDHVLTELQTFLDNRQSQETNVLVIGANASGLETLYKFTDLPSLDEKISRYFVLSTHGVMPDAEIDPEGMDSFVPKHLQALQSRESLTAKEIAEATFKDLDLAESIPLGAATTVGIISRGFGSLLSKLSPEELANFACFYGNEIGRRQRCAGQHYISSVEELKKAGRLTHIAGRYERLKGDNKGHAILTYTDTHSGKQVELEEPLHLVINCIGSTNLTREDIPPLMSNLIRKGYIKPNASNIGISVNAQLEASRGIHVIGPMLAGNVVKGSALWHLEHCGRIIWTSELLADIVTEKMKELQIK